MAGGRPSKLTPETQQKIVQAVASGNYLETAAAYGGITYTTFNNWMNRGESRERKDYIEFFEAVKKAEADAEVLRVARISKAANEGNWQADAWYLERRYPNRWGKRVSEVSGPNGDAVTIRLTWGDGGNTDLGTTEPA